MIEMQGWHTWRDVGDGGMVEIHGWQRWREGATDGWQRCIDGRVGWMAEMEGCQT